MENSHKKRWSRFEFNIDDWDFPFPKVLRIYGLIYGSEKTFSMVENGINPLGNLPLPQNIWPKGPEDIYF